jgi:hypothetical protein
MTTLSKSALQPGMTLFAALRCDKDMFIGL